MDSSSDKTVKRLNRILTLIPYIRQHPNARVSELAEMVGCTAAELLEDLNRHVLLCGVPPYLPNDYIDVRVEKDRVSVRFAEHFKRPVRFTMQEAMAMKAMLSSAADSETAKGLLAKLDRALSPEAKRKVETFGGRIGFLDHPLTVRRQVEEALQARREIEIEYYTASRDAMTRRVVRPYGIVFHHGCWYIVAYCLLRKKELPFRLDRIRSLRALDSTYQIPKRFDISKYEKEEMYIPPGRGQSVDIRFSADIARWIKEEVPPGKITELADGGIVLHLSTVHFDWLVRWVLPFGKHAEILSPPPLRALMLQTIKEILHGYGSSEIRLTRDTAECNLKGKH